MPTDLEINITQQSPLYLPVKLISGGHEVLVQPVGPYEAELENDDVFTINFTDITIPSIHLQWDRDLQTIIFLYADTEDWIRTQNVNPYVFTLPDRNETFAFVLGNQSSLIEEMVFSTQNQTPFYITSGKSQAREIPASGTTRLSLARNKEFSIQVEMFPPLNLHWHEEESIITMQESDGWIQDQTKSLHSFSHKGPAGITLTLLVNGSSISILIVNTTDPDLRLNAKNRKRINREVWHENSTIDLNRFSDYIL
jgi:hypothetical protein